jgi:ABC-type nitrate/sulfonate/bicarbonate transport system substrate-binding protein
MGCSMGPCKRQVTRFRTGATLAWVGFVLLAIFGVSPAYALEKVRIGLSVRNVTFLPFYYAKDRKIFEKHGLDSELIQMRSDLQMVGLVSGEVDFNPAIGPATLAIAGGMPLKAVAVFYRAPLFSLVSPANLGSLKELEGKRVAVSRLGSDSHRYGVMMMEQSGVDAKKVTFIQSGSTTVSLAALQQGSVAAAVLSPPFTGAMAERGYKVLAKSRSLPDLPWLGLVTSRQKIEKQPERVKSVLRAMREALESIRADRQGVIAYIEKNFNVNATVAAESYEDLRGVLVDGLMMPEEQIKRYLEGAHARGELPKPLSFGDAFDFSPLKGLR